MATTDPNFCRRHGAGFCRFLRRYRLLITSVVGEGSALCRLPLVVRLILTAVTELLIVLVTGRSSSG